MKPEYQTNEKYQTRKEKQEKQERTITYIHNNGITEIQNPKRIKTLEQKI